MQRRIFLQIPAATLAQKRPATPDYRVVGEFPPSPQPGMPGPYPGLVVAVHSEDSIDTGTEKVDPVVAREMISQGMRTLTGAKDPRDAWRSFFSPEDVVAIKVNCSGTPGVVSAPEVVAEIVRNLVAVGVKANQIYIYERFLGSLNSVNYGAHVPEDVQIVAVEKPRGSLRGYDPNMYVDVNFFGEENTRSNLVRLVSERFTKIINVPNMKDHGAAGVTGCLKNIALGNFSNVDRSHRRAKTNTLTFIGTLAATEPLRSRTVLQIMDGLRGVWHGGPFSRTRRFRFYPKQIMFGTDPVAIDRLLLDVIEDKRKAEGALSIWDRSMANVRPRGGYGEPNVNRFIREPGHIEYASKLGLGVYELEKIRVKRIEL
jgi:hypothetical protein